MDKTQISSSEEIAKSENNSDVEAGVKGKSGLVTASPRTKPFIVVVACCAALGGLIFGYDIAGAGATFVMDGFQRHFGWECAPGNLDCTPASDGEIDRDKGLINGLFGVGATFGAILNPYFAEKYGRRPCLFLSTLVFIVGASIQTAAPLMWVMWLGRVFSGMGIGMLSMCVPVYIAECAPEHQRGTLGTLWQVAVTAGILIASAANLGLSKWDEGWRLSYGGNIIFAFILLACLVVMPESPRWLAGHASDEDLTLALNKLRYDDEIESEKQKLYQEVEEEKNRGEASWSEVFSTSNTMRRRVVLGMSLQAFQQLCGINAIMFYAPDILNTFFTEDQAIAGTFYLNTINFLATFIAVAAIDKFGRVKLLLCGGILMFFSLVINTIFSALDQTLTVGWCVLAFASLFIIGFAFSWGPVVWVVCSEMFPLRTRTKAVGLTTSMNWFCTTIIGAVFPAASRASLSACFAFFAAAIAVGMVTVYLFLAETANRTVLEIDEAFKTQKPALKRKDW
jgi:SP family sugar:H+ symporter-like MFS transporter